MSVDIIVARSIQCYIGSDEQDWSDSVASFVPAQESIGETGLQAKSGTLTIQANLSNPESIDPEANPDRWKPGTPIQINIPDSGGDFVAHPFGSLFILSEPTITEDEATGRILQISIAVGCWLTWGNTEEPADDASNISIGTDVDLATVCSRYLQAAGIPSGSISLGGPWGLSVCFPLPKPQGSFVAKAGEIAYAAGFRVLYQDKLGVVRAKQVVTEKQATPDLSLNLNASNLLFRRLADPQEPVELVRVAGNGLACSTIPNPITDTQSDSTTETYTREEYDLSVTALLGINGSSTPVTTGDWVARISQQRFKQQEQLVIEGSTSSIKITVDDTTTIKYYDNTVNPPRLDRVFGYTEKARGIYDGSGASTTRRTREFTTFYTFGSDGQITQQVDREYEIELLHDPAGSPTNRALTRRYTQTWTKQGRDRYKYQGITEVARILVQPEAGTQGGSKWEMIQDGPAELRPAAGAGENAPPAPETWDGAKQIEEITYEGEATWTHPGGATGRTRKRLFTLPADLAFSNALCQQFAEKWRDILAGRKHGRIIQLPINDALLAYDAPLPQIAITCLDGQLRTYLLDAIAWEHQLDRAFVAGVGILIDTSVPGAISVGVATASLSMQGITIGIEATAIPFGVATASLTMQGIGISAAAPIIPVGTATASLSMQPIGINAIAIYEAEDATIVGATMATTTANPGYTGTGYVDYGSNAGDYVEFSVTVGATATYAVDFRYAQGSDANRPLQLLVNGSEVVASLAFSNTTTWQDWQYTAATAITLNSGTNTIRLVQLIAGGPNLDHARLTVPPAIPFGTASASLSMQAIGITSANPVIPFGTATGSLTMQGIGIAVANTRITATGDTRIDAAGNTRIVP